MGDRAKRVAFAHAVIDDTNALLGRQRLNAFRETLGSRRGYEQVMRSVRVRDPMIEGRVKREQFFLRNARKLSRDVQVDLTGNIDFLEEGLVRNRGERQAVRCRVCHDATHGKKLRNVGARFAVQLQAEEIGRLAGFEIAANRACDVRFARVVGSNRKQPIAVELIRQEFQVVERSGGCGEYVASPVVVPILLETVASPGRWNELPQARSSRAGIGNRIERALDDRQECELHRHAARLDLVHDVKQIALAALEGAIEILRVTSKPALLFIDGRVVHVNEREAVTNAFEQIARRRKGGARCRAEGTHQRRIGLSPCIERFDRVFDLLGSRGADQRFIELPDECCCLLRIKERRFLLDGGARAAGDKACER